jgi:uncharacterized protein (TIGR02996 family)
MDLLSQHEAFLRAIFDTDHDDTARLVYADFLQENGEEELARFIRLSCEEFRCDLEDYRSHVPDGLTLKEIRELGKWEPDPRIQELREALARHVAAHAPALRWAVDRCYRGFPARPDVVRLRGTDLGDVRQLRERIVQVTPEWNGTFVVKVLSPPVLTADRVEPLLSLSAFKRATEWDFSGCKEERVVGFRQAEDRDWANDGGVAVKEATEHPTITTAGVIALSRSPEAGRITALDIGYNDLDDDAALALVESPYLGNLQALRLRHGNRISEKAWQQVVERFGEEMLGYKLMRTGWGRFG